MRTYHIGIAKRGRTMVIEARRCIDYLSCEIYDYLGKRGTTKKMLHERRYQVLAMCQEEHPNVYGDLRFAIVD